MKIFTSSVKSRAGSKENVLSGDIKVINNFIESEKNRRKGTISASGGSKIEVC